MNDEELEDEFLDGDVFDETNKITNRQTVNEAFLAHCGGESTQRTESADLSKRQWTNHLSRDEEFDLIRRAKATTPLPRKSWSKRTIS